MIDDVVDLFGLEFVLDGDGYGAVSKRCQKHDSPVGAVASTEGYLVTMFKPNALKHDVDLLNLTSHIMILKRDSFVVSEGIVIPIPDDTILYV